MKPHMAHIAETIIRKRLAEDAKNPETSYEKYTKKVEAAKTAGYTTAEIIAALECEIERVRKDHRPGDALFLHGVNNSKLACISSISVIIAELKGEKDVKLSG